MSFPKDFVWGTATASYQIEGAAYEDGRGLSVWDMFCKQPGRVFEGHTGDVACDHYHRYKEDVKLMAQLGIKSYRFSIAWPRVIPDGVGKVNHKGIEFYNNLINELLIHNIIPCVTLYHWDYPYPLYKKGGWLNPDSPAWFAEYAKLIAETFGDRVKQFITFNEPQCFIGRAFDGTIHAPGVKMTRGEVLEMAHNVMLGHGLAVQAIRAAVSDSIIGYAPTSEATIPASNSEADVAAARNAYFAVPKDNEGLWYWNPAWWSDPIMLGHYPEDGIKIMEEYLGFFNPNDMKTICQPLDFYGQNIYRAHKIRATENGYERLPVKPGSPKSAFDWYLDEECLYWGAKFLYERYNKPIVITENGMSCHDAVSLDGKVHDPNRIDYLHRQLRQVLRAIDDGVDIAGYYHWSFMDNFEWAKGYNERFGLVYIDYETQQRIPKDSFDWYKQVIQTMHLG